MNIYSEKLGQLVEITDKKSDSVVMDDTCDSLVGWSHSGWNNDNGGAGW